MNFSQIFWRIYKEHRAAIFQIYFTGSIKDTPRGFHEYFLKDLQRTITVDFPRYVGGSIWHNQRGFLTDIFDDL